MKDRDRRAGPVAGLSLVLAASGPVSGAANNESEVSDYALRVAAMTPKSITVCYTNVVPQELFDPELLDPDIVARVIVFDADCVVSTGIDVEILQGVDASLEIFGGYEIIPLDPYRKAGATEPPVFEDFPDSSTFTPAEGFIPASKS